MSVKELITKIRKIEHGKGHKIVWKKSYPTISVPEALALIHSELSSALNSYRNDDKEKFTHEIADVIVWLLHVCGDLNLDIESHLGSVIEENKNRPFKHGRRII